MLVRIRLPKNWVFKRRASLPVDAEELLCPQCQSRIAPDAKFCSRCRVVILRRYCQPCRRLVPDHTEFCPYCGASRKEKRKRRNLTYLTNIAMIMFLILATVLLWPKQESDEPKTIQQSNIARANSSMSIQKEKPKNTVVSVIDPAAGVRLNLKGHSLIQQGRYHEAVSLLYQATKSFPEGSNMIEYFFAQYNLGHSLRKIGKSEEAIPFLERCVAYDSHNQMFLRELEAARRDLLRKENY